MRYLKPFGFHDYNQFQMHARCAISDSGTIAEESSLLDFAAVIPRDAIERPEAMGTGNIIVCGLDPDAVLSAILCRGGLACRTCCGRDRCDQQPTIKSPTLTNGWSS